MKYFAIFAAVLGVALALPTSSVWTLQQLSDALENPLTEKSLIPYLEHALDKLMASIFAGNNVNAIVVHLPADIAVQPAPAVPEVVPAPAASSGPLVQLIVNINAKNQVVDSPVAPEIDPSPVIVEDNHEYEDIIAGPAIVEEKPVISNPVDIMNPVPSPVVDGDFGIIV